MTGTTHRTAVEFTKRMTQHCFWKPRVCVNKDQIRRSGCMSARIAHRRNLPLLDTNHTRTCSGG